MTINKLFKNNHSTAKGFTLIEVIVALSIGVLIMTMFMTVISSGFRNIRTTSQTKELHANAVYILNTLTYEIKQAESLNVDELDSSILKIKPYDSVTKTINMEDESIKLDGVELNNDNVEITGLEFIKMPKSVRINFTIESSTGDQSLPVTTTIAQRNNL